MIYFKQRRSSLKYKPQSLVRHILEQGDSSDYYSTGEADIERQIARTQEFLGELSALLIQKSLLTPKELLKALGASWSYEAVEEEEAEGESETQYD